MEIETRPVVKGVSLRAEAGKISIVMGPNGSGKSSLLSGIFGHPRFRVTEGSVLCNAEDITKLPPYEKARRGLFFSLQNLPAVSGVSLSKLIVESTRALGGEVASPLEFRKEIAARIEKFGFSAKLLLRPVNQGLSGGEKKQAEMIQLLALRPKFAILDEIDSGVDVDSQKNIAVAIRALADQGVGFLIVSHHGAFAKLLSPDHVYLMKEGSIVREGDVALIDEITEKGFVEV